jgi:lysozyme family protein
VRANAPVLRRSPPAARGPLRGYQSGKYIRDGVYDPNAVDSQPGCAGLLMAMMELDPSINFSAHVVNGRGASTATSVPKSSDQSASQKKPSIGSPSSGSIGALIKSLLGAIFGRK